MSAWRYSSAMRRRLNKSIIDNSLNQNSEEQERKKLSLDEIITIAKEIVLWRRVDSRFFRLFPPKNKIYEGIYKNKKIKVHYQWVGDETGGDYSISLIEDGVNTYSYSVNIVSAAFMGMAGDDTKWKRVQKISNLIKHIESIK